MTTSPVALAELQAQPHTLWPYPELDLSQPELWQDLHTPFAAAREESPIARLCHEEEAWAVLRYSEVEALLRDPRLCSLGVTFLENQGIRDGLLHEWWQRLLFATNPPQHTRLRALVSRAFTPNTVTAMQTRVRAVAHQLLDEVEAKGEMDVVTDFAHHLPVRVISDMLGIPEGDHALFGHWTSELGLAFSPFITPEIHRSAERALEGLYQYVGKLIAQRRAHPAEDLLSALLAAEEWGDSLSYEDLLAMVVNLLFAGHDSTKSLLSIGVATLLQHPDQLALVRDRPELWPHAVDEVLRFDAPVAAAIRRVRAPLRVGGVRLEYGAELALSFISANRDPRKFERPDHFDVTRSCNPHLSFGSGLHYCVGAGLAKMEAIQAFSVLFGRCPQLTLAIAQPRWVPFAAIRRLEALPVCF